VLPRGIELERLGVRFDEPEHRLDVGKRGPVCFRRRAHRVAHDHAPERERHAPQPLDVELARRLTGDGVRVVRDAHLGTGISKSLLVDWTRLAPQQVADDDPDAVVMFIGANEGFPLKAPGGGKSLNCCGPDWAAAYANKARAMMAAYRRGGRARVYWLTLPTPRDPARAKIAHAVNAAVRVAAEAYRAQVRVLDMNALFTPGGRYRAAMPVNGTDTIVREPDGIHLNETGAGLAAQHVIAALQADFTR